MKEQETLETGESVLDARREHEVELRNENIRNGVLVVVFILMMGFMIYKVLPA